LRPSLYLFSFPRGRPRGQSRRFPFPFPRGSWLSGRHTPPGRPIIPPPCCGCPQRVGRFSERRVLTPSPHWRWHIQRREPALALRRSEEHTSELQSRSELVC